MHEQVCEMLDRRCQQPAGMEALKAQIKVGLEQARRGELLDGEDVLRELFGALRKRMRGRC